MKLLLVGGFYIDEIKDIIGNNLEGSSLQIAPDMYQKAFIKGLVLNDVEFDALSLPFASCYPMRNRKSRMPFFYKRLNEKVTIKSISYSTLIVYKYLSQYRLLLKELDSWCKSNSSSEALIIVSYSTNSVFLTAVELMKKRYTNLRSSVIVTDMIEDAMSFSSNQSLLKKVQLKFDSYLLRKAFDKIDYYVLLTEFMRDRIPQIRSDNYCVIEGLFDSSNVVDNLGISKFLNPTILYSGTLDSFSNVDMLVKSFESTIDPNFRLIICGAGYYASFILNEMKKDRRIVYKGVLDQCEVLELQKQSTLLVNPRKPSEITKYSFPSKTIEYMMSGTPVLLYKLPGIPTEYYDYCFSIDSLSEVALTNELNRILGLDSTVLDSISRKASTFILNRKSEMVQVQRFLKMIKLDAISDR